MPPAISCSWPSPSGSERRIREGDLAARLGGDEFAILVIDQPDLRHAIAVARRLIDVLGMPFPILGRETVVGASVGIAMARDASLAGHAEGADDLLRNADVAMYTAKSAGKRRFAVFDPTMHASIVARHELSAELARSVARERARRPLPADRGPRHAARLSGSRRSSAGATRPAGLILPDEFIGLAEENGTILALGRWVLAEACRTVVALARRRRTRAAAAERQRVAPPAPAARLRRRDRDDPQRDRARPRRPRPRGDRDGDVPRHDDDDRPAPGHPRPRRADRHRRLRDRLLVARLPAPVPRRHPQDRPRLRRLRRGRPGRPGPSPTRSWPSGRHSACGSWPRASRSPASSSDCATSAASSARASCSPGPSRPSTLRGCSESPAMAALEPTLDERVDRPPAQPVTFPVRS